MVTTIKAYENSISEIQKIVVNKLIDGQKKRIHIKIGKQYIVIPSNPLKKKHRDRIVTIRKFMSDRHGIIVSVKFQDNNRVGRVPVDELYPLEY